MGQDPREIRQDIEQTRERMGDTVEALGHKTDVTGRAKEAISDRMGSMKEKVSGVGSTISESTPDGGDLKHGARKAAGVAQENPLGLALGAVAVGFVGGLLIPSTRVEDEKLGPMAATSSRVPGGLVHQGHRAHAVPRHPGCVGLAGSQRERHANIRGAGQRHWTIPTASDSASEWGLAVE